ncbi:hypothetical protein K0M31_007859 [Melipona bicolor]|uniref:Uncharacterized protein n=1 Tax=Melipona bicolor TaxID=60889 RepID=A0AA40KWF1_9HYME|nr:hypothetical protein K0M31_007859 [Melipona bicolor]
MCYVSYNYIIYIYTRLFPLYVQESQLSGLNRYVSSVSSGGSILKRDAEGREWQRVHNYPPFQQHPSKLLVSLAIDLAPTTLAFDLHGRRKARVSSREFVPSAREFPVAAFALEKS